MNNKTLILWIIVSSLFLLLFSNPLARWQRNFASVRLSHLAYSSNEVVDLTPELTKAIELICIQRMLNCEEFSSLGGEGQEANLVDIIDTIFYPEEKSPIYFLNQSYSLMPRDLYIDGNGNFTVTDSRIKMFGTNYIEFRLYIPYKTNPAQLDISLSVANSKPPPIKFDVTVYDDKIGTIRFDKGDDSVTTKGLQFALPSGYQRIKIWYANDWFDPDKGIDRNAVIRKLTLTPKDSGF